MRLFKILVRTCGLKGACQVWFKWAACEFPKFVDRRVRCAGSLKKLGYKVVLAQPLTVWQYVCYTYVLPTDPHGEELIRADAKLDAMLDLFNLWCDMIEDDRKDPLGDLVEYKYPRPATPEQLSEQEDK